MINNKTLIMLTMAATVIIGCTIANPDYHAPLAGQPDTNTAPAFKVDPKLETTIAMVKTGAQVTAPFNPYGGITLAVVGALGFLGTGISTFIARHKSNQHQEAVAALGVMGEAVVKAGTGVAGEVLQHSSNTDHYAAIAEVLNNATGANQDHTGAVIAKL